MARSSTRRLPVFVGVASLALALAAPAAVRANPTGGQVAAGQATISAPSSGVVQVNQASSKAVIDWRSFSIAPNETTRFVQPDASSIALNRVVGGDPSQILGRLQANGQVWLINPNGILFGTSAHVDVAGLLATTLDLENSDFLSGKYRFAKLVNPSAIVENRGTITIRDAGLGALVAPGVENSGVITANLGQVQLSAASGFTVDLYGDGKFNFLLDGQVTGPLIKQDGSTPAAAVVNTGRLLADGGKIFLTANAARSVIDHAINMSGVAEARTVAVRNGQIVLDGGPEGTVEVAGRIAASGLKSGETGGKIEILGDGIHLGPTARVDTSGSAGGGKILIGGDFQGGAPNPALQALTGFSSEATSVRIASSVTVDAGAIINASAIDRGSGGQIVVWSAGLTSFLGTITARGGIHGGKGGLVETSGRTLDTSRATIDLRPGIGGEAGAWLRDPHFIVTAASDTNTGIVIRPGDLIATYGVGKLLPDTDDGGVEDPNEESESRFAWSVVPRNGLFAQVGSVGPTPIGEGIHFFHGVTTGTLVLGMNSEDGGPAGQYDVDIAVVSKGTVDTVLNVAMLLATLFAPEGPGEIFDEEVLAARTAEEAEIAAQDATGLANEIPSDPSQLGHIFRDSEGHLLDTPANRELLTRMSNNPANRLGVDKWGTEWFGEIRPDGTQVWTSVRNNTIRNGGVNEIPHTFNPETGLSGSR